MFVCILQRIHYHVYQTLNYYETFVRVLCRVYYYVIVNAVMNRLNEHFKGYYHVIVISYTTSGTLDWLMISFG